MGWYGQPHAQNRSAGVLSGYVSQHSDSKENCLVEVVRKPNTCM